MELSDLIIYFHTVRKRLWLILLLVVVTATTIIGVSLADPPLYRTSVRFRVTAPPPGGVTLYQTTTAKRYWEDIAATRADFMYVVNSLEVAWQTVEELELPMTGKELAERVTLEEERDSDFVRVIVRAEDPGLVAEIANTLVDEALRRYGELYAFPNTLTRDFISSQLDQVEQDLSEAQTEMLKFKTMHGIGALEDAIGTQYTIIRSLILAHDETIAEGDLQKATRYEDLINRRRAELENLIQLGGEFGALESRVRQLGDTYNFLVEKETEARLKENEALNLGFIQVLGQALVPEEPEPRISIPAVSLGIVVALGLGVIIAFLWEYIEQTRLSGSSTPVAE